MASQEQQEHGGQEQQQVTTVQSQSQSAEQAAAPSPNCPQQQQQQTAGANANVHLSAILEDDKDSEDDVVVALQEQAEADYEERKQIGGGLLKQVTIKSGYLLKKGERRKTWKKRYFVLRPDRLCYYKDEREYQILQHIAVSEVHACAQVEVKKHENSFGIVTPQRTFYVKADTPEEADDWVKRINRARKEIEKQKQVKETGAEATSASNTAGTVNKTLPVSSPVLSGNGASDGTAVPAPSSSSFSRQPSTSFSSTRPIPIRQSVSGSPFLPHQGSSASSVFGQSYTTDTSALSTSESSNAIDHFMSSSYASTSSAQSGRVPAFLQQDHRFPIDPERHSENEDLYDESAMLHHRPSVSASTASRPSYQQQQQQRTSQQSQQYLTTPHSDKGYRGALSSSEEDDEPEEGRLPKDVPPAGALKSRLHPERVVLSGYLMKQGKRKNWRKRWFVLTSDKLMYARSHMDTKAHRCINLESVLDAMEVTPKPGASEAGESAPHHHHLYLPHPSGSGKKAPQNSFKLITPKRTYILCAPSEEDEIKWISSIRVLLSATRGSPGGTEVPTPTQTLTPTPTQLNVANMGVAKSPPAISTTAAAAGLASPQSNTLAGANKMQPPPPSPRQYCSIESQLEIATGRLQHLST